MLIRFLLIIFCLSMMIASAKAGINEGIEFYQKRHEGSNGTLASVENINKAIEQFTSVLLIPGSEKNAAIYMLKSYKAKIRSSITEKNRIFHSLLLSFWASTKASKKTPIFCSKNKTDI